MLVFVIHVLKTVVVGSNVKMYDICACMYSSFSVKCSQRTVRDAYHIICKPCSLQLEICCKCGKKEEIVIPWVVLYVCMHVCVLFVQIHAYRGLVTRESFCVLTMRKLRTSLLTMIQIYLFFTVANVMYDMSSHCIWRP